MKIAEARASAATAARAAVATVQHPLETGTPDQPGPFRQFLQAARICGISIAVSAIAMYTMSQVDQTYELNRILASDLRDGGVHPILHLLLTFAGLLALCFVCHYFAEVVPYVIHPDWGGEKTTLGWWIRAFPWICGVGPVLAYAWSLHRSGATRPAQNPVLFLMLLMDLAILAAYLYFGRTGKLESYFAKQRIEPSGGSIGPPKPGELANLDYSIIGIAVTAFIIGFIGFVWKPVLLGDLLGPIAAMLFGLAVWVPWLSFWVYVSWQVGVSYLGFFLGIVLVRGWFNLGENRHVPLIPRDQIAPTVAQAFKSWIDSRPDITEYGSAPYPVVIVYAQGGGIRAAVHAAFALSILQDRCPAFAQHVFAVSGVSGGSLGAAIFGALTSDAPPVTGFTADRGSPPASSRYYNRSHAILRHDLLAPIIGRWTFADIPHEMLPTPWGIQACDRSKALTAALEHAWQAEENNDRIRQPMQHVLGSGAGPSLFLNTTSMYDGRPFVLSNLSTTGESLSQVKGLSNLCPNCDISLSDAACLSARFPVVTTEGILDGPDGREERVVDGGYYDNSGLPTALGILRSILASMPSRPVSFILFRVGSDLTRPATPTNPSLPHFADGFAPLYTFLDVFQSSNSSALDNLDFTIASLQRNGTTIGRLENVWAASTTSLPLGWQFSEAARQELKRQIGYPRDESQPIPSNADSAARNGYMMSRLFDALAPPKPGKAAKPAAAATLVRPAVLPQEPIRR